MCEFISFIVVLLDWAKREADQQTDAQQATQQQTFTSFIADSKDEKRR